MSLPEHVLNTACDHGRTLDTCHTDRCQEELAEREEHAARERLADAIADGEHDQDDADPCNCHGAWHAVGDHCRTWPCDECPDICRSPTYAASLAAAES